MFKPKKCIKITNNLFAKQKKRDKKKKEIEI